MTDHKSTHRRFLAHLERRQASAQEPFDLDGHLDRLSSKECSVGYVRLALERTYGANLRRLFPNVVSLQDDRWGRSGIFLGSGAITETPQSSHAGLTKIFQTANPDDTVLLFELGFLASVASWSHAFKERDPKYACLSFVFDDMAHYYMSDYPNRLIRKLNGTENLSSVELERARRNMSELVANRITKYNAQPFIDIGSSQRPRVLVCDQTYADGSTIYGRASDRVFQEMLLAAIRENPDAEVLVKTHPDTVYESSRKRSRPGFFSGLRDHGPVRLLREPMNPLALMEKVDKVYVATSGMGFEALLCGKPVVCFGAPFYAGWGLTDDRQLVPHRSRRRSLEELFYYFYIWYTRYVLPHRNGAVEMEEVIDYLIEHRIERPKKPDASSRPPKVSVIIPVHNVEQYLRQCLDSVLGQTLSDLEVLVVNDCSPDDSQAIVDDIAARDPRVKPVVLEENMGQGLARNVALDLARGTYVFFLDSDDYLASETFIENAVAAAERTGADMVRGRKVIRDESGGEITYPENAVEGYFPGAFGPTTLVDSPELLQNANVWNFLYRREFIEAKHIRFALPQWEERPFLLKAMLSAKTIVGLDEGAVVYRIRPGSTVRRRKVKADFLMRHRNIALCFELFREYGAAEPDSPLRGHYAFCVSKWMAVLFGGFQLSYLRALHADERLGLLREISEILKGTHIDAEELSAEPFGVGKRKVEEGYYRLIYAACRSGTLDLVDRIICEEPLPQRRAYSLIRKFPGSELERSLGQYLKSHYPAGDGAPSMSARGAGRIRFILHIGSTKTGSTYLQHFCDRNRGALLRQGVWYPEFGMFWQRSRPHKTAGHAAFLKAAHDQDAQLRELLWSGLDALDWGVHTIILSSEAFFLADRPHLLLEYLAEFDCEVLVYLRRQDDWANSQYAEYAAGGAVARTELTPQEWLEEDKTHLRMSYDKLLEPWAQVLGDGKVTVRPYEKAQLRGGDLLEDFAECVGIRDLGSLARPKNEQANHFALDARLVMAMRHFNRIPYYDRESYFEFVEEVTRKLSGGSGPGRGDLLGPERRAWLLDRYATANAAVAKRYLGRKDGLLFLDMAPRELAYQDPEHMTIRVGELDIMFEAYERVALRNHRMAVLRNQGKSNANGGLGTVGEGFRRKWAKLRRDPRGFFLDSRVPGFKAIGRRLSVEGASGVARQVGGSGGREGPVR